MPCHTQSLRKGIPGCLCSYVFLPWNKQFENPNWLSIFQMRCLLRLKTPHICPLTIWNHPHENHKKLEFAWLRENTTSHGFSSIFPNHWRFHGGKSTLGSTRASQFCTSWVLGCETRPRCGISETGSEIPKNIQESFIFDGDNFLYFIWIWIVLGYPQKKWEEFRLTG
jgi:hypothetical protein